MYAQLTTGKPLHIISRVRGEKLATEMLVSIDTAKNRPELNKKTWVWLEIASDLGSGEAKTGAEWP
jgi:DNA topoisomerase VI subunit B